MQIAFWLKIRVAVFSRQNWKWVKTLGIVSWWFLFILISSSQLPSKDPRAIILNTLNVAMSERSPTIPPSVSKQLAANNTNSNTTNATTSKRVPPDAAEAISECLRLFVREAHRRASIEVSENRISYWRTMFITIQFHSQFDLFLQTQKSQAECDDEGEFRALNGTDQQTNANANTNTPIHAHHVTRIAGDLLMDFS